MDVSEFIRPPVPEKKQASEDKEFPVGEVEVLFETLSDDGLIVVDSDSQDSNYSELN